MIAVTVPSFSDDLLQSLFESMERSQAGSVTGVIVGDNGLSAAFRQAWSQARYVAVPSEPFIAAQAINIMVAAAPPAADLVLVNDDMTIVTARWLERIATVLATLPPTVGIVNLSEMGIPAGTIVIADKTVAFLGAAIPRWAWTAIGPWDERYTGYGYEDTDYCFRLWHAGYHIGLTATVRIDHAGTVGYIRRLGSWEAVRQLCDRSFEAFYTKWGLPMPEPRQIEGFAAAPHMLRIGCTCHIPATLE